MKPWIFALFALTACDSAPDEIDPISWRAADFVSDRGQGVCPEGEFWDPDRQACLREGPATFSEDDTNMWGIFEGRTYANVDVPECPQVGDDIEILPWEQDCPITATGTTCHHAAIAVPEAHDLTCTFHEAASKGVYTTRTELYVDPAGFFYQASSSAHMNTLAIDTCGPDAPACDPDPPDDLPQLELTFASASGALEDESQLQTLRFSVDVPTLATIVAELSATGCVQFASGSWTIGGEEGVIDNLDLFPVQTTTVMLMPGEHAIDIAWFHRSGAETIAWCDYGCTMYESEVCSASATFDLSMELQGWG